MTRKRFIKRLMARGYDRNKAELTAEAVKRNCMGDVTPGEGYAFMWWLLHEANVEELTEYINRRFSRKEAAR